MNHAITGNMGNLLIVMRAVKSFKKPLHDKHGSLMEGIFGRESRLVAPPNAMRVSSKSQDTHDRRPMDKTLVTDGVHRQMDVDDDMERLSRQMDKSAMHQPPKVDVDRDIERNMGESEAHYKQRVEALRHHPSLSPHPVEHGQSHRMPRAGTFPVDEHAKGHAHDPLEDTVHLNIGYDPDMPITEDDLTQMFVSESPGAVDVNIYEQAYQDEMQRILERRGKEPSMYLTRRIEHRDDIRKRDVFKDAGKYAARSAAAKWDALYNKGSATGTSFGDAGKAAYTQAQAKFAARRSAEGKSSTGSQNEGGSTSSYFEYGKQAARKAANAGLDGSRMAAASATEKLGFSSKGGAGGGGISSLISRAQAKARSDASAMAPEGTNEAVVDDAGDQPPATHGTDEPVTSTAEPQPATSTAEPQDTSPSVTADHPDEVPAVPGGFPVSPTLEKNLQ